MSTPRSLVTSSWFTNLPDVYGRIGISRGAPRGQSGFRMYRALAPGPWFRSVSPEEYRALYMEQLGRLDARQVLDDLITLAAGRIPALLCFEKPPPDPHWCHRGLVSAWFSDALELKMCEFGHEASGCGWEHPKLPVSLRSRDKHSSGTDGTGACHRCLSRSRRAARPAIKA
jgi:hypothetical protein